VSPCLRRRPDRTPLFQKCPGIRSWSVEVPAGSRLLRYRARSAPARVPRTARAVDGGRQERGGPCSSLGPPAATALVKSFQWPRDTAAPLAPQAAVSHLGLGSGRSRQKIDHLARGERPKSRADLRSREFTQQDRSCLQAPGLRRPPKLGRCSSLRGPSHPSPRPADPPTPSARHGSMQSVVTGTRGDLRSSSS